MMTRESGVCVGRLGVRAILIRGEHDRRMHWVHYAQEI